MLVCPLGEPFSINIAMMAALLLEEAEPWKRWPIVLIGSLQQWRWQVLKLGHKETAFPLQCITALGEVIRPGLYFLDIGGPFLDPRLLSHEARGHIATACLEALVGFEPGGKLAVLTCPIDKYNCRSSGFKFPGQTEFFEQLWKSHAVMILAGSKLKVGLATNHVPLGEVLQHLSQDLIAEKIEKFATSLQLYFGISEPRIGICGLNPHCGEQGLCGSEERTVIEPAIELAKQAAKKANSGLELLGPWPADTIFWRAMQGQLDGVLAMFHDQGLGPLKTVHFDSAVNISGGLPFLRISPDHGPAKDLFLQDTASKRSFQESWRVCTRYLS